MSLKANLEKIKNLTNELDGLRPIDKNAEQRIIEKLRLEWNFHSNHIEGNRLEYGETKALLLFGITANGKPLKDHIEMQAHNEALKYIEEVVKEERPLTEQFIREIHELILKEDYQTPAVTAAGLPTKKWVRVGKYKTEPNHVKTKTGEIFRFTEPQDVPVQMQELLRWYSSQKEQNADPFMLASEFHYRFIRIHPFDDGNGRTVRILMNFILMRSGLPPIIVPTSLKENYLTALEQADSGDLEAFIDFLALQMLQSLELVIKGAKGLPIDDSDDLDKAFAVLKNKLDDAAPEHTVLKRSSMLTAKALEDVFLIALFELDRQWEKLRDLYEESEAEVKSNQRKTATYKYLPDQRNEYWMGTRVGKIDNLALYIYLQKLSKLLPSVINHKIGFNLEFGDYSYTLHPSGLTKNAPALEFLYGVPVDEATIKESIRNQVKRLLFEISNAIDTEKNKNK